MSERGFIRRNRFRVRSSGGGIIRPLPAPKPSKQDLQSMLAEAARNTAKQQEARK